MPTIALLDTGSEISAVNAEWLRVNRQYLMKVPELPISGIHITTATSIKTRIKKQIYMNITCGETQFEMPMLVINKLISPCILGMNVLQKLRAQIDIGNQEMTYYIGNDKYQISLNQPYIEGDVPQHEPVVINKPELKKYQNKKKEIQSNTREEDMRKIQQLNEEYADIVSERPTKTTVYEHTIKVTDPTKFVRRTYPIPIKYREQVDLEVQQMLEDGIISRSNSDFLNPMVIVRKKNGSVRLCLDMRNLNSVIEREYDCTPSVDELFLKCEGARYLSKLDLTSSFWQIPIKKQDRKYTAFLYKNKVYEFNVVPFGLSTSLSAIVKCIELVLGTEVERCSMVFVDDILVISKTVDEHVQNLRTIYEKFRRANMSININKCEFLRTEIKFLGHIISEEGVKPDPEKIKSIMDFPTPINAKGVRAFLGLTGYYRKFSPEYAKCTQPLLELTSKKTKWKWQQKHTEAMHQVKALFNSNIMLFHPQPEGKFIIYADASEYAIGSIIFQETANGEAKVIAYASRVYKGAEQHYYTTEKEILAIVYALKQFRYYIYGKTFEIHTDHQALSFLMKCKTTNSRLMRWILVISEYSFTLKYCKGKDNTIADTLSRYIPLEENYTADDMNPKVMSIEFSMEEDTRELLRNIAKYQDEDIFIRMVKLQQPLPHEYCIRNDILFKLIQHDWKVVLSDDMLHRLIIPCHQSLAHASAYKCSLTLKEDFYIPGMLTKIKKIIKKCFDCQTAKQPNLHTYVAMQNMPVTERNEIIAMDFLGPLPNSTRGTKHLLVCIDLFTKEVRLYPIKRPTTKTVLNIIIKKYMPENGRVQKIITDQGKQFQNKLWASTLRKEGIKPILTSIRHPQANLAERINKELGKYFRIYCHDNHRRWAEYIPFFQNAINNNYNETTGFPPIMLGRGMKPTRFWNREITKPEHSNIALPLQNKRDLAKERIKKMGVKRKERYDRQHKLTNFALGERVLLKSNPVAKRIDRTAKKFFRIYNGPHILHEKKGPHTFLVYDPRKQKIIGKFHASSFRKLYE